MASMGSSGVGKLRQDTVAGGGVTVLVHRLDADMGCASSEMCAQTFANLVSSTPQAHRIDEAVGSAIRKFGFGKADAQPIIAVVVEYHIARQLLAAEGTRLRRIGFERNLLLGDQP